MPGRCQRVNSQPNIRLRVLQSMMDAQAGGKKTIWVNDAEQQVAYEHFKQIHASNEKKVQLLRNDIEAYIAATKAWSGLGSGSESLQSLVRWKVLANVIRTDNTNSEVTTGNFLFWPWPSTLSARSSCFHPRSLRGIQILR